jgi:hypothetical protein
MRRLLSTFIAASLLGPAALASAADIDVMTQNQYFGTDFGQILKVATAPDFDPVALNAAVVSALAEIAASRPAERVKMLAANIAQRNPHVVGLQELHKFTCMPIGTQVAGEGCEHPSLKAAFTDRLVDTLQALGGRYVEVARVTNFSINLPQGIPFSTDGGFSYAMVGLADRDAIFVRADVTAKAVNLPALLGCKESSPLGQGCNYNNGGFGPPTFTFPNGPTITVERGYIAVDARVRGKDYRVFNTHLEQRLLVGSLPDTRMLQVFQASELIGAVMNTLPTNREVIVVGDFNSDPTDPVINLGQGVTAPTPYMIFAGGGFTDSWTMRPQPGVGFSCCQAQDLSNRASALYERIDLIFTLTRPARVVDMKLIGHTMGDKTRPPGNGGLWPSDHASLAAKLFFD